MEGVQVGIPNGSTHHQLVALNWPCEADHAVEESVGWYVLEVAPLPVAMTHRLIRRTLDRSRGAGWEEVESGDEG